MENDANLCAVGEHARGAAQGVDVVACLTVGTGIGMGILVNGKLFRGAHGASRGDRRPAVRPRARGSDGAPARTRWRSWRRRKRWWRRRATPG